MSADTIWEDIEKRGAEAVFAELPDSVIVGIGQAMQHSVDNNIPPEKSSQILSSRIFSVNGFAAYHQLVMNLPLLPHMRRVIEQIFGSYEEERDVVIELFRGSAKTTSITVAYSTWLVGLHPDKSILLVQVGDGIADDNATQVADIIENNANFALVFPHVKPDKQRRWSKAGYEVKRTDMDYKDWRALNAGRKDPSFIGLGYESSSLIGKRPYFLILDDINDHKNTVSFKKSLSVKTIMTGTIFPAANHARIMIYIGTPWNERDALHYCLQTGEFDHIKIAVYDEDGELTWPDMFDKKTLAKLEKKSGKIEYARMMLLDLSRTKGLTLKKDWLHYWPHEELNADWPVVVGVDFTSTEDPRKEEGDYFALGVFRVLPGSRGLVLETGLRERLSQAEAELAVVAWAARYPTLYLVGVEAIFSGQMFYNNLLANAEIKAAGVPLAPIRFQESKGFRFEKEMAPMFQRKRVYLSDAEDEYITAFEDEWLNWQGDALEDLYHNDTLDAAYSAIQAGAVYVGTMNAHTARNQMFGREEKKPSPVHAIRRSSR